jgi:hypothetical protein
MAAACSKLKFLGKGSTAFAGTATYSGVEDGTDRRARLVDLTRKGRILIEQIFSEYTEHLEKLAEVLTPAERVELMKALRKLGKQASAYIADQSGAPTTELSARRESLPRPVRNAARKHADARRRSRLDRSSIG